MNENWKCFGVLLERMKDGSHLHKIGASPNDAGKSFHYLKSAK
jgi:hypothetical protein